MDGLRFGAAPVPGAGLPYDPDPGAGVEVDFWGKLALTLDGMTDAARRLAAARERDRCEWMDCHPIPLNPLAISGAGPLIDERWGPRKGFAWQILLLTVTFGAGATSATVYRTADATGLFAANAKQDFLPDANSMATWEPKGLILLPGTQLSWLAAGGGITVSGEAIEIAIERLAAYLM